MARRKIIDAREARLAYQVAQYNLTPSDRREERFEWLNEQLDAADRHKTAQSRKLEEKISRYFDEWLEGADSLRET